MHVHNVYFWLNDTLDTVAISSFEQGLNALTRDANVIASYFGPPAGTERDVVDNTYSYGLVLVFADQTAHDRYQVGSTHQAFVENHLPKWHKVIVYDIESP